MFLPDSVGAVDDGVGTAAAWERFDTRLKEVVTAAEAKGDAVAICLSVRVEFRQSECAIDNMLSAGDASRCQAGCLQSSYRAESWLYPFGKGPVDECLTVAMYLGVSDAESMARLVAVEMKQPAASRGCRERPPHRRRQPAGVQIGDEGQSQPRANFKGHGQRCCEFPARHRDAVCLGQGPQTVPTGLGDCQTRWDDGHATV